MNIHKTFFPGLFALVLSLSMLFSLGVRAKGQDYSNIQEKSTISIPGYEYLMMAANEKEQMVPFYNPQENTCFFRISLVVFKDSETSSDSEKDVSLKAQAEASTEVSTEVQAEATTEASTQAKTEAGTETSTQAQAPSLNPVPTLLWTSDLLEPGQEISIITLKEELEKGEYPAVLKYECFSLRDQSPLNGSNIELTLKVQ